MANTLKFGNGVWANKKGSTLAYNDESGNFKPLPFKTTRSTSATRVNKEGLIEVVSNEVPRIDFKDNTKGALILEPTRSNLQVYSEQFDNAAWTKTNLTVNTNQTISPNGELTADLLTTTSTVGSYVLDVAFVTSSQKYNYSVFVKKSNVNFFGFIIVDGANVVRQYYDINNGVVGSSVNTGTPIVENIKIENYGNGWYRCSLTIQALNSAVEFRSYVVESDGTSTAPIGSKIFLWGAQVEQGSYATSYIPTNGSAATRVVDSYEQTPPVGVIGQTQGVLFLDFISNTDSAVNKWLAFLGGVVNYIGIYILPNSRIRLEVANTTTQATFDSSFTIVKGQQYKCAIAYANNDFTAYVNGIQLGIDTNGTVPITSTIKNFYNLSNIESTNTNNLRLYNTRLSNNELQALTTI